MSYIPTPPVNKVLWEAASVLEFPRLLLSTPKLLNLRNSLLSPEVLVIPGYFADDRFTYILRQFLTYAGAEAWGWGLGVNKGNVAELVALLTDKVQQMHGRTHEKIHIIGWSLGGVIAREIAREIPDKVEQVITMGSPIVGGPKHTVFAGRYLSKGYDLDEIAKTVAERNQIPINVPLTMLFSKQDRIVAWEACIDHLNRHARHIEVQSPHMGMGISAEVFEVLVSLLAGMQDDDMWAK